MENDLADNFETAEERTLSAALKAPEAQEPMPPRLMAEMRRLLSGAQPASPCVGVRRWLRIAAALAILAAGAGLAATIVANLGGARSAATDTAEDVGQATDGTQQAQTIAATPSATISNLPQSPSGVAGSPRRGAEGGATFSTQGENMNISKTTTRTAAVAAASLALAATAQATDLCYRLPDATPYTWDGGIWITHTNKVVHGAVPTASDNVFIWGTGLKADENDAGKPLCVASGEVALTKDFTIGWNGVVNSSSNNKILFEVQDGGVMTNAGPVKLGVVEDGYTKQTNPGGLATVRAGGSWVAQNGVTVGASSNRNRIVIEQGGEMDAASGSGASEFIVANVAGHSACVTNAGTLAAYDFFVGGNGNGDFENSGDLTITRKFTIGRQAGSYGHVRHSGGTFSKGTPSAQPVHVGYNGTGVFEVFAPLTLQKNERLVLGGTATGEGTLVLGPNGSINNVTNISVGAFIAGARGHLQMAGGTLTVQALASGSPYALLVGRIGSSGAQQAWGDIGGFGTISRDDRGRSIRIKLYGRVVASGGDLDLATIKTVGEKRIDANVCGSNGWYAVNGGRLLYPAAQDFGSADHVTIGDYVYRGGTGQSGDPMDITLVNALQLRLFDANGTQLADGKYNHAALYAADHGDIPGQVPGSASQNDIVLGVWRLGHFDAPGDNAGAESVSFDKAWLRFRIDSDAIPEDVDWSQFKVRLYRWDGSAWKVVGTAVEPDLPYVETTTRQPAYSGADADGWNIGWYAAALVRNGATTIVFR